MQEAESSNRIHIALHVDRSDDDSESGGITGKELPGIGHFSTMKRLRLRGNRFEEVADLGRTNATEAKDIAEFIAWGAKAYPAKRTALVFMNHGAAGSGWGHNMSAGDSTPRLKDLGTALEQGRRNRTVRRQRLRKLPHELARGVAGHPPPCPVRRGIRGNYLHRRRARLKRVPVGALSQSGARSARFRQAVHQRVERFLRQSQETLPEGTQRQENRPLLGALVSRVFL